MRLWFVLAVIVVGAFMVRSDAQQSIFNDQRTRVSQGWNNATALNTRVTVNAQNMGSVTVTLIATSTMTGGVITFEYTGGSGVWFPMACVRRDLSTTQPETTFTLTVTAGISWVCQTGGMATFGVRLSTVITGTGTATVDLIPTATQIALPLTNTTIVASTLTAGTAVNLHGLTSTFQTVIGSAHVLDAYYCHNPNTTDACVLFYDNAAPTVGTTVPKLPMCMSPSGMANLADVNVSFGTAITAAAYTTSGSGGANPAIALDCWASWR